MPAVSRVVFTLWAYLQGAHSKEYQQGGGCDVIHWDAIEGQHLVCLVKDLSKSNLHFKIMADGIVTGLASGLSHNLCSIKAHRDDCHDGQGSKGPSKHHRLRLLERQQKRNEEGLVSQLREEYQQKS